MFLLLWDSFLQSIKEGLDTLKPRVDSVEGERDTTVTNLTPAQAEQVRKAVDNLRQEWAQVSLSVFVDSNNNNKDIE